MVEDADINLSGWRYNWLGTVFYIAYILSQWLLMGWKQFPPYVVSTVLESEERDFG